MLFYQMKIMITSACSICLWQVISLGVHTRKCDLLSDTKWTSTHNTSSFSKWPNYLGFKHCLSTAAKIHVLPILQIMSTTNLVHVVEKHSATSMESHANSSCISPSSLSCKDISRAQRWLKPSRITQPTILQRAISQMSLMQIITSGFFVTM